MGMEQIQHFVLVMMENRSFDHYLGALNLPPENRDDVEGLGRGPLPVNLHLNDPPTDTGVPVWPLDDVRLEFYDPPHEWPEVRTQWDQGKMDGFVSTYERFHARTIANLPTPANVSPLLGTSAPAPPDLRQMGRVVMTSVAPVVGQGRLPGALQVGPIFASAVSMNPSILPPSTSLESECTLWGPPKFVSCGSWYGRTQVPSSGSGMQTAGTPLRIGMPFTPG